jgi:hypothetical protein
MNSRHAWSNQLSVLLALGSSLFLAPAAPGAPQPRTYCNPINLDYGYCPIPYFVTQGKHRTTADPAVVVFRNDFHLFSTNQSGYWWSSDLARWNFVPRVFLKPEHRVLENGHRIYDDLCAPAAFVLNDELYVIGSTYTKDFPIWKSANPRQDEWTEAVEHFEAGAWDPAFFVDDDGRLYLYHGAGNTNPIYGQEIDRRSLQPLGERQELIDLDDENRGWERFGEANDNTFLRPFIEGAWMTKANGRYYLQYAAPGTEFSGYADGVFVGDAPLGPFQYQPHNPVSYKPGGFARGAGHGSSFQDRHGHWWHASTISIGVKDNFERRIGIWPAGFDDDGVLYCNTAYGDYPHYLPNQGNAKDSGRFAGWMLLNYAKPVVASSTLGGFSPNLAVDEDIRTYWSAESSNAGEHLTTDLGRTSTVRAIQINYADQDATLMGKVPELYHEYVLQSSIDGTHWQVIADTRGRRRDTPHDFVELVRPVEARFVRIENHHVPTGKFAISGLRVFGNGHGEKPRDVPNFKVLRGDSERRNAWLRWAAVPEATGYVIHFGTTPGKLYSSAMVYGTTEYYVRSLVRDRPYYFRIEAFNEQGISTRSPVVEAR